MNNALLYIEDQENNIALVGAMLRRRPQIELHVAMDGRDGVRAATDIRPGLILLDNHLPDATGSENHARTRVRVSYGGDPRGYLQRRLRRGHR